MKKMRVSRKEMENTHHRIVDSAAKLLRERGVEGAGIASVMADAGLTQGGFYRHFDNKETMLEAALASAFEHFISALADNFDRMPAEAALAEYHRRYLSSGHKDNPGIGCPVAAVGGDIARGSDSLKDAFGRGVSKTIDTLARGMKGSRKERQAAATRELAMLAGAIVIARASDPETGNAVLQACR